MDTIEEKKNKEISRKDAEIRIAKSKVAALQSQLDQKTAENLELVAICDQLMEGNKWKKHDPYITSSHPLFIHTAQ